MVTLVPDTMVSNCVVLVVAALSLVGAVPSSPPQMRPTAFVTPGIPSASAQNYPNNIGTRRASRCPPRDFSTPLAESASRQILPADRRQGTRTSRARDCYLAAEDGDDPESSSPIEQTTIEEPLGCSARQPQRRRLIFSTVPPLLLAATTVCSQASIAAVTGGRIGGGGYTTPDRAPSAPPMQQQQQRYEAPTTSQEYYTPRAGRDIYGSDGSRTHIKFSLGGRAGRRGGGRARFNPDVGDVTSTSITPGDVVMIGGVTAGVVAAQRNNRKRFLEDGRGSPGPASPPATTRSGGGGGGGSRETCAVTTLQLSTYCDRGGGKRDLLATLDKLSQTADVSSPSGLSALVNEVSFFFRFVISFIFETTRRRRSLSRLDTSIEPHDGYRIVYYSGRKYTDRLDIHVKPSGPYILSRVVGNIRTGKMTPPLERVSKLTCPQQR